MREDDRRGRLIYELGLKAGVALGASMLAEQVGVSLSEERLLAMVDDVADDEVELAYRDALDALAALLAESEGVAEGSDDDGRGTLRNVRIAD